MALNAFGCPRSSLKSHFNMFADGKHSRAYHTSGIFTTASYINHSCHCNARRSFIGDMQIVRAARDISAGTEITFPYAIRQSSDTYDEMQKILSAWGFRCICITCQAIKEEKKAVVQKRLKIHSDIRSEMDKKNGMDIAKFERAINAIESTYTVPATIVPRLMLWDPYLLLTQTYSSANKAAHVVTYAWKALGSLGFVIKHERPTKTSPFEIETWGLVLDQVVETWVYLWVAYSKLAPHLCAQCERYARISYKICIGEDETFDEHYGRAAKSANGSGEALTAELERLRH